MKPKKITNEKPLKINKTFEEAMEILANPPKKADNHSLVDLVKKRRKAAKKK